MSRTKEQLIEDAQDSITAMEIMLKDLKETVVKATAPDASKRTNAQNMSIEYALRNVTSLRGEATKNGNTFGFIAQGGALTLSPLGSLLWGIASGHSRLGRQSFGPESRRLATAKMIALVGTSVHFAISDMQERDQYEMLSWDSRTDSLEDLASDPDFKYSFGLTIEELDKIQHIYSSTDRAWEKVDYLEVANKIREIVLPNLAPFSRTRWQVENEKKDAEARIGFLDTLLADINRPKPQPTPVSEPAAETVVAAVGADVPSTAAVSHGVSRVGPLAGCMTD